MTHSRYVPTERPRRSAEDPRTSFDDRQKPKHVHFGPVVEYPIEPGQPRPSGERTRRTPRRDPSPPPPARTPPSSRTPNKPSSHHRSASSWTTPYADDDYTRRMRSQHDEYTSRRQNTSSHSQKLLRSASERRSGDSTSSSSSHSSRPRSWEYSSSRKPLPTSARYSYPSPSWAYPSQSSHGGVSRHLDEARYGPRTVSAR